MIDTTRHVSIFDPVKWGSRRVDVVGVGATGSKVALSLAKLGVKHLHLWDSDMVEPHNLANQTYLQEHVGIPKTTALTRMIRAATHSDRWGTEVLEFEHWNGHPLGEVVFCMVDSMAVRKQLFDSLRFSMTTRLVIDSRMGVDTAYLLNYTPGDVPSLNAYKATLFNDDDAQVEVSACGTSITVGPTGDIISGYAVWNFMRYANEQPTFGELAIGARNPSAQLLSEIV